MKKNNNAMCGETVNLPFVKPHCLELLVDKPAKLHAQRHIKVDKDGSGEENSTVHFYRA